jgi:hypothetical protein
MVTHHEDAQRLAFKYLGTILKKNSFRKVKITFNLGIVYSGLCVFTSAVRKRYSRSIEGVNCIYLAQNSVR